MGQSESTAVSPPELTLVRGEGGADFVGLDNLGNTCYCNRSQTDPPPLPPPFLLKIRTLAIHVATSSHAAASCSCCTVAPLFAQRVCVGPTTWKPGLKVSPAFLTPHCLLTPLSGREVAARTYLVMCLVFTSHSSFRCLCCPLWL
jgi:hypothetical protein